MLIALVLAGASLPLAGLMLWLAAMPYMAMTETLARTVAEQHRARARLETDRGQHIAQLEQRDARIAHLEGELADARASARRTADTTGDPVYRRVGLSPSAPDWLVQAARTAYRRRLHPDVHPPQHRRQAHDRYIRAEEAFERITRLRA